MVEAVVQDDDLRLQGAGPAARVHVACMRVAMNKSMAQHHLREHRLQQHQERRVPVIHLFIEGYPNGKKPILDGERTK